MEHAYIEPWEKEFDERYFMGEFGIDYIGLRVPFAALKEFIREIRKSARTETLMECRGLLGEDNYDIEPQTLRTAIDNLIKKETV